MRLLDLWEAWEVKCLLLSSLVLQVVLQILTELLRRISNWPLLSTALTAILWLLYQTADDVAIYVLGHMSLSARPLEQRQLMALWASLLMVHLGGQDTVTAFALEDNELWLRHLFTLFVQAAGAAYVLYKYAAEGSRVLLAAAVLMFLVGIGKYLERIHTLKSSRLGSIKESLEGFKVHEPADKPYPVVPACLDDAEGVLQGAHDLLHVCMGQIVDYKVWPSRFQMGAILDYHDRRGCPSGRSKLLELVGMQLSLTRDILHTKTAMTRTWHGFVSRVTWTVSTIVALVLFQQFTMRDSRVYSRGDIVVTYVLLAGALFLEATSLFRVVASTWTCAWLQGATGFRWLHATSVYLRRGVKTAQRCRRWSSSIRQHDMSRFHRHGKTGACYWMASRVGLGHQWNRLRFSDSILISHQVEDLLLREVQRMVEACGGGNEEHIMRSPDQLALGAWGTCGAGARFYDGVVGVSEAGFNGSILTWHYATDAFLNLFDRSCIMLADSGGDRLPNNEGLDHRVENMNHLVRSMGRQEEREGQQRLAEAIRVLSRYLMFLLVEKPRLLPGPFRRSQYENFYAKYKEFSQVGDDYNADVLRPEVRLANNLLARCEVEGVEEVLRVISVVWVEMLCYAASHCINNSHARQLCTGIEFVTVVWILTTALFNRFYRDNPVFEEQARHFLQRHVLAIGTISEKATF